MTNTTIDSVPAKLVQQLVERLEELAHIQAGVHAQAGVHTTQTDLDRNAYQKAADMARLLVQSQAFVPWSSGDHERLAEEPGTVAPLDQVVEKAINESKTLAAALSFVAIWETERIVRQAFRNAKYATRDTQTGGLWDTCFERAFTEVLNQWPTAVTSAPTPLTLGDVRKEIAAICQRLLDVDRNRPSWHYATTETLDLLASVTKDPA